MMSRTTTATLVLAALAAANGLRAADPSPAYEHLKALEWQVGDWVTQYQAPSDSGPIKKGDTVTVYFSVRWAADRSCLVTNGRSEVNGKTITSGLEVIAWDHEKSVITHSYQGSWGSGGGVWTKVGDSAEMEWAIQGPYGRFQGKSHAKRVDGGWEWQLRERIHDGQTMPDMPMATFRPRTGTPAGDLWTAFRDALEGKWVGTGNLSADIPEVGWTKGVKFTYHLEYQPAVEGRVLSGDGSFQVAGSDETATVRVTWHWDPALGQIQGVAPWSLGGVEELTVQRQTPKGFLGVYSMKRPDGPKVQGRVRITFPDADTHSFVFIDGPRKGETLSSWKRQK